MLNVMGLPSAFPPVFINHKRWHDTISERCVRLLQPPRSLILRRRFPASPAIGMFWSTGDLHENPHPCASHPTGQLDTGAGDLRRRGIGADDLAHGTTGANHACTIHELTEPAIRLSAQSKWPTRQLLQQSPTTASARTPKR